MSNFYSALILETSRQTKKMAEKQEINTPAEEYFRNLSVTFDGYVCIKQPDLTNSENFYSIYSPKNFTLKPRDDIVLDLKFNITTSKELDPWISLLATSKLMV